MADVGSWVQIKSHQKKFKKNVGITTRYFKASSGGSQTRGRNHF